MLFRYRYRVMTVAVAALAIMLHTTPAAGGVFGKIELAPDSKNL